MNLYKQWTSVFFFQVQAYNGDGGGAFSTPQNVYIPVIPQKPTGMLDSLLA